MTIGMLLLLVVPLVYVVLTILENSDLIVAWTRNLTNFTVPPPPRWVEGLPLVGRKLAAEWAALAATSSEDLAMQAVPYVRSAIEWFADSAGGVGLTLLHFLLTLAITAILYAQGETAATVVRRFLRRLAGERGESSAVLAGQAIRAVALGIVVTAVVQSTAAGIGLAVSGVPYAAILAAIIFGTVHSAARPNSYLLADLDRETFGDKNNHGAFAGGVDGMPVMRPASRSTAPTRIPSPYTSSGSGKPGAINRVMRAGFLMPWAAIHASASSTRARPRSSSCSTPRRRRATAAWNFMSARSNAVTAAASMSRASPDRPSR